MNDFSGFGHSITEFSPGSIIVGIPGLNDQSGGFYIVHFDFCGTGRIIANKECDDGNNATGDGCNSRCRIEESFTCTGTPSVCVGICGDGILLGNQCDDANSLNGDGCDSSCIIEAGKNILKC